MTELELAGISAAVDSRGQLVAVEHASIPFHPARTFVVTSEHAPAGRGGHVAGCRQLLVLVAGRIAVRARGLDGRQTRVTLDRPGAALLLEADDHVDYRLELPGSVLLVLADRPFRSRPGPGGSTPSEAG